MKVYCVKSKQFLPITIDEAWRFFSTPANLQKITPAHMKFDIRYQSGGKKMYPGQIITYRLYPLPGIATNWTTEITHVDAPHYFVDEQRFGPYAMWHHEHHFKEIEGGVEMTDEINYAIPLGFIGRLANWLFVGRQVKAIFDHRFRVLNERFNQQIVIKE